ncbi:hypothetical protein, partial [Vibrio anguillarum]|uniref:hypothetical protein n=1 Tax=Vibrio anguillarum TaxID=55601 RepID=UPI001BE44582
VIKLPPFLMAGGLSFKVQLFGLSANCLHRHQHCQISVNLNFESASSSSFGLNGNRQRLCSVSPLI